MISRLWVLWVLWFGGLLLDFWGFWAAVQFAKRGRGFRLPFGPGTPIQRAVFGFHLRGFLDGGLVMPSKSFCDEFVFFHRLTDEQLLLVLLRPSYHYIHTYHFSFYYHHSTITSTILPHPYFQKDSALIQARSYLHRSHRGISLVQTSNFSLLNSPLTTFAFATPRVSLSKRTYYHPQVIF